MQAELKESRAEVLAARDAGDESTEQALVGEWNGRRRRLMAADPQLVDELRQMVAELRLALADVNPPQDTMITNQATTFDNSRANQAGHDLYLIIRE